MKKKELTVLLISICLILVLGAASLMAGCAPSADKAPKDVRSVDIAGGSIGGSTNLIANSYAGLLDKFMGIERTTVLTYPMDQTPAALSDGDVQIAISNTVQSYDPWFAQGKYADRAPMQNLRELHPRSASPLSIFVPLDSPIKTFRDLIGKRVSPGTKAMGPEELMVKGCPAIGLDWEKDFELVYMGHREGGSALVAGKIAAYMATGPPPHPSLSETDLIRPLRLIGFTPEDAAAMSGGISGSSYLTLDPKYYHMDQAVITLGHMGHTMALASYDEEIVYQLTKLTIEESEYVGYFTKPFQDFIEDQDAGLKFWLQTYPSPTPMPIHKAAVRYY
ncbi:TAXI family TRAP transporter solute-binding subunit, partial [Chloroflexota bacterium]